jgi:hypothetical protein
MTYESKQQRERREKEDRKIIELIFKPFIYIVIWSVKLIFQAFVLVVKQFLFLIRFGIDKGQQKFRNKTKSVHTSRINDLSPSLKSPTIRELLLIAKAKGMINQDAKLASDDFNKLENVTDFRGYNGLIGIVLLFVSYKDQVSVSEIQRTFMTDYEKASQIIDEFIKLKLITYIGEKRYKVLNFNPETEFEKLIGRSI